MSDQDSKKHSLTPSAALALAEALGIACFVSGLMLTQLSGQDDLSSRVFQMVWLCCLFFGTPLGFILISEFAGFQCQKLRCVQRLFDRQTLWFLGLVFLIMAIVFPQTQIYLALLRGIALVSLSLLEHHARPGK